MKLWSFQVDTFRKPADTRLNFRKLADANFTKLVQQNNKVESSAQSVNYKSQIKKQGDINQSIDLRGRRLNMKYKKKSIKHISHRIYSLS